MKREGTISTASLLAILAVVGISLQPGSKSGESTGARTETARSRTSIPDKVKERGAQNAEPWCSGIQGRLADFLQITTIELPGQCYVAKKGNNSKPSDVAKQTERLKFVVALTPDPVHTHLSVLFDQFIVAIQEGAQDENYEFDSSWMPWEKEEPAYSLLGDQKVANLEKSLKEDEPGIILFRKSLNPNGTEPSVKSYSDGLVVFVVGEEATAGINRNQFRNTLKWLQALQPKAVNPIPVGILGPTFSGSIPSLMQVLSEKNGYGLAQRFKTQKLAIYSGSVSSKSAADRLQSAFPRFHSFVEDDDRILERFLQYMSSAHWADSTRVAILSEDETAYGRHGVSSNQGAAGKASGSSPCDINREPLRLYYPRDISALRSAYQSKSLFRTLTPSQPAETSRLGLPTDLADPSGNVRDSIRSYGGNQTPLVQEAILMEIVSELHDHKIEYVLLRGSNPLDQLFLTNFLRRSYPNGRIVIFSSDLIFIRERGTNGLSGVMVLSTYPLFPLEHEWTQHQAMPTANRVFSGEGGEATYIALRLLLNDETLNRNDKGKDPANSHSMRCRVLEDPDKGESGDDIFLPRVSCANNPADDSSPLPDYSPPYWVSDAWDESNPGAGSSLYTGPPTWLSVVAGNRFWPLAALGKTVKRRSGGLDEASKYSPNGRPDAPLEMKIFFLLLAGFSVFHAWCCWSGSYTAKPAFRAHFASQGDWCHSWLVFIGSCCVAFMAMVAGMGCGVFFLSEGGLAYPVFALSCTVFVVLAAWVAILGHGYTVRSLVGRSPSWTGLQSSQSSSRWGLVASCLFVMAVAWFWFAVVFPLHTPVENQEFVFWRAMHLVSGVSPIVPLLSILAGLYLTFWLALHGLALLGPDRPRLPRIKSLILKINDKDEKFLQMFSQEGAADAIEGAAFPLTGEFAVIFLAVAVFSFVASFIIAGKVPIRSLASSTYAIIFLVGLDLCCSLALVEAWRLYGIWTKLKRLLAFLDRLPLRRTMTALHGFSWGSVWKMSGNVLEVRYKVISRQMESMNHTIAALQEIINKGLAASGNLGGIYASHRALLDMRTYGMRFASWYSANYSEEHVGNLMSFSKFQARIAATSGTLLSQLLVPAWRLEQDSLIAYSVRGAEDKGEGAIKQQPQDKHIRNAEELVCLVYLGFVQNILGRLRTIALATVTLFLASTLAMSTYPFDPRQGLSAVLIVLFAMLGIVIVKVYAEMHRDSTLSHVTNTKPGELGTEFWFKVIGFGVAPLLGLLTRIFPGVMDSVFSWLQPSMSTLH